MQPKRLIAVFGLLLVPGASAQQYVISTFAGGAPPPTPAAAVTLSISQPVDVAADTSGNVYFTSSNCVFKLDQNGVLTRVAGNSKAGYSGDGGPARSAQLNNPDGLALDGAGNLFIADEGNYRVRMVSTNGVITTIAGNGTGGFSGDDGPATNAQFGGPVGNFAGGPYGVAVDGAGNMFIADASNNRVRKVSTGGIITTVAGNGTLGFSGDGGPATNAHLYLPSGVAADGAGNLFITDLGNNRVRKVSTNGIITTVAGNGSLPSSASSGDGGPATNAPMIPYGLTVDGVGNLFVDENTRVRKVSVNGTITTVAGNLIGGFSGDGGPATNAQLGPPVGVLVSFGLHGTAVSRSGDLFIADAYNNRVRKVSASGIITTVVGNGTPSFSGDGGLATNAQLRVPSGVAVDGAGNLFIADVGNNRVRKVSNSGLITTVAGNGTLGYSGEGGPATNAQLGGPFGVAADGAGNLFIADAYNDRVLEVSTSGIITRVAGNGAFGGLAQGFSGDGGPATNAKLDLPWGVAVDGADNLFIADAQNNRVRKVSTNGIITTVAGNGTGAGYYDDTGDGGLATNAQVSSPAYVAVDGAGNLFIASGKRVRRVSTNGIITTVAGSSAALSSQGRGFSGDGGPAASAELNGALGVAVDSAGNLFIADSGNFRVRKVSTNGIITTVAGNGTPGYSGDGGPAPNAQMDFPNGVAVDNAGNVYVGDSPFLCFCETDGDGANAVRVLK